jgi:hypothetical protein
MSFFAIDPVHWTTRILLDRGPEVILELAKKSSAITRAYRLVLGRCLLAIRDSKLYETLGYSSEIHYAVAALGLSKKEACEYRRVAGALEFLPQLTRAAELGQVPWGRLREIVRKASAETEEFWLRIASRKSDDEIRDLVAACEFGKLPWQGEEPKPLTTRLVFHVDVEQEELFERIAQLLSQKLGRPLTVVEAFGHLAQQQLAEGLACSVQNVRQEARRNVNARRRRQRALLQEAHELAQEWGMENEGVRDQEAMLALALGVDHVELAEERATEAGRPGRVEGSEVGAAVAARPGRIESSEMVADVAERPGRVESSEMLAGGVARPGRVEGSDSVTAGTRPGRVEEAATRACEVAPVQPPCTDQELEIVALDSPRFEELRAAELLEEPLDWENRRLLFRPQARTATAAQRREVLRRDGYCCRTPGCPHRMWLELHHTVFFSRQGETVRANLVTLCSRCHRNVHNGSLKIAGDADGRLIFTDARGHDLEQLHAVDLAGWLNFYFGWCGREEDGYRPTLARAG